MSIISPYVFSHSQIEKAVSSVFSYLQKRSEDTIEQPNGKTLLFDAERDINLVFELKFQPKASFFRSVAIPLKHSFRAKDENHFVCVITRDKEASLWSDVLTQEFKVKNVTKVMGFSELNTYCGDLPQLRNLCDVFDLFILHPAIAEQSALKLVPLLRGRNKSVAILPQTKTILRICEPWEIIHAIHPKEQEKLSTQISNLRQALEKTLANDKEIRNNPKKVNYLKKKLITEENEKRAEYQKKANVRYKKHFMEIQHKTRELLAQKIARYRDSTFYPNYHFSHRIVKVAEWGSANDSDSDSDMDSERVHMKEVVENIEQVLKYFCVLLPKGGLENVLRISLHIGNTKIQLPLYHNVLPVPIYAVHTSRVPAADEQETDLQVYKHFDRVKKSFNKSFKHHVSNSLPFCMNLVDLCQKKKVGQCSESNSKVINDES